MKQLTAIAWKEWRENSPLLWIALGVFLGLPIIGGLEYMLSGVGKHHFDISGEPGVIALGGVLAIFVAVGAACRDLNGKLEDFWLSRPVTGLQWMLIKFIIGVAIVLLSLSLPLIATALTDRSNFASYNLLELLQTLPVVWCLFYCIGFLAGCLLQRPAHSAVLALAALLLIYFVPTLLFPGNEYQISDLLAGRWAPPETIAWGFVIAGVLFLLAMIASQQRWRIEPGPKFMYGTIATAFLIFLFSTGYRLGTNLPVLQQINLMPDEQVDTFYMDGAHGYVVTGKYVQGWYSPVGPAGYFRQVDLASDGLHVGPPLPMWYDNATRKPSKAIKLYYHWLPNYDQGNRVRRGDVEYFYYFDEFLQMQLDVISFKDDPRGKVVATIPLPLKAPTVYQEPGPMPYIWHNRLYLIDRQFITVDISQPLSPRVISSVPLEFGYYSKWLDRHTLSFTLPQIPDLPDAERMQIAIRAERLQLPAGRTVSIAQSPVCDGQILCQTDGNNIAEFQLQQLTSKTAIFKHIGTSTNLETLFNRGWLGDFRLQGNLLYASETRGDLNPVIKVYATDGPARPRLVGHFSAESNQLFTDPLPDGRAIIAGSKIWLVGPPPAK